METTIVDLLCGRSPEKARDMMLEWSERRTASWANAAREASVRSASDRHLPQIRGQLRYHLGERALAEAARAAQLGALPLQTNPVGGVFIIARVGRFSLVSVTTRHERLMPRRSLTRKTLSQPNAELDPQYEISFADKPARTKTQLTYLGCLVSVPSRSDPMTPAQMALAIPTPALDDWLCWMPLHRLHALLQEKMDSQSTKRLDDTPIKDLAFPTFRVPKKGTESGEEE